MTEAIVLRIVMKRNHYRLLVVLFGFLLGALPALAHDPLWLPLSRSMDGTSDSWQSHYDAHSISYKDGYVTVHQMTQRSPPIYWPGTEVLYDKYFSQNSYPCDRSVFQRTAGATRLYLGDNFLRSDDGVVTIPIFPGDAHDKVRDFYCALVGH